MDFNSLWPRGFGNILGIWELRFTIRSFIVIGANQIANFEMKTRVRFEICELRFQLSLKFIRTWWLADYCKNILYCGSQSFRNSWQGKAIPNQAKEAIVDRQLDGTTQRQIGRDLNIPKSTVQNIDNFAERGHSNYKIGGSKTRLARTEDVVAYTEFCKQQQPRLW